LETGFEITVTGESMWPVLVPGKRYKADRDLEPRVGDIVVAQHPTDPSTTIVKRVATIIGGRYSLVGTVSWSANITVERSQILGVVITP